MGIIFPTLRLHSFFFRRPWLAPRAVDQSYYVALRARLHSTTHETVVSLHTYSLHHVLAHTSGISSIVGLCCQLWMASPIDPVRRGAWRARAPRRIGFSRDGLRSLWTHDG